MIKFGDLTRGNGKIFQALTLKLPKGGRIEASSEAEEKAMPCIVAETPRESDSYVLILAALTVAQTVRLRVLDHAGHEVDSAIRKIGHASAALTSKMNTFSKRDGIEDLRNMDSQPLPSEAHVECPLAIIDYETRLRNLQIRIDTFVPTGEVEDSELEVVLLSRDASSVAQREFTILHDAVVPGPYSSRAARRKIECSTKVDCDIKDLIIWVRFGDPSLPDGFMCAMPWQVESIKGASDSYMLGNSGAGWAYERWFLDRHRTNTLDLEMQKTCKFDIEPTFSIIVPLFKTPLNFFWEMVDSVLCQTYGKFELILVNASPEEADLAKAVKEAAEKDQRIKVVNLDGNYGITLNTNEGIKAASGDFLCFFDHDDTLEPDILFEYVKGINKYPETDLLYCDEDKMSEGKYFEGLLKPDFDWDLIRACNYVCHLLTVRKSIVDSFEELPGKQYDGSQDHNMTLRVAEQARNIYHARKVLYHWRVHPGSTAGGAGAKPWTQESGRIAVQEHLDRVGIAAKVTDREDMDNFYDVEYLLPSMPAKVSIIIPNKDHVDYLDRCLSSVYQKTTYPNFEVIVVENNSEDPSTFAYYEALVKRFDTVRVVTYEGSFNFSAICNLGAKEASGEYLLFLNNDTELITDNWLELLVGHMQRTKVGCVGARLFYPDNSTQHAGIIIPKADPFHVDNYVPMKGNGYFGFIKFPKEASAVTGACLMIRKDTFDGVGGFDEGFPVAYNDVDLCLRLRERELLVVVEPRAMLYHYESVSRGYDYHDDDRMVRLKREMGVLMSRFPKYFALGDPYYNCNCAPGSTHYELGW